MNELRTAALVAVLMAGATTALVRGIRPRRSSIAEVRALLFPTTSPPGTRSIAAAAGRRRAFGGPLLSLLTVRLRLSATTERRLGSGLRLLDLPNLDPSEQRSAPASAIDVVGRVVVSFVAGLLAVLVAFGALMTLGALPAHPLWLLIALGAGAGCAWIMWSDVQQRIVRRRREFQHAVNDFVQLVALGLTTDQSVEEAIHFALGVSRRGGSSGEGGEDDESRGVRRLLEHELTTAPQRGIPLWEALDRLGTEYDRRELSELASSIERQGTQGVSITDTVSTMAAAMRAKALDELEREADKVNANLAGPTVGFVVAMIVFLAYPLALRITEAFGG